MRTFVVPDLHGNWTLMERLLDLAGVPATPKGRADEGIRAVQLGDLINATATCSSSDKVMLARARWRLDIVLVGNHEYPYFGGPRFSGFAGFPDIASGLRRLDRAGILKPCLLVGDTLLTHAGVAASWGYTTAEAAAGAIERGWAMPAGRAVDPILKNISAARGGSSAFGGVLWSDWDEPRAPFDQVHGHSPRIDGPEIRHTPEGHKQINLDVGAHRGCVVGLWLEQDGLLPDPFLPVFVHVEERELAQARS